jgi:hypothetical protein
MKKNLWNIAFIAIICFSFATCDSSTLQNLTHQNHNWSGWRTTTDPTCTVEGEETRTCSICGSTQSRKLYEIGHDWGNWVETDSGARGTCSRCGYFLELTKDYFFGGWQNYITINPNSIAYISISEDGFSVGYENSWFRMSDLTWTVITSNGSIGFKISGKIAENNWHYEYIFPGVPSIGGTYDVSVYFSEDDIRVPEFTGTFSK